MSLVLAGVMPLPADARDLLILRSEVRRGELFSCDVGGRLDAALIPRREIVWIGLGDPPLPPPAVRNPLQDELHLREGPLGINVGRDPDPEPLRTMDPGARVMKGEYTVTLPEGNYIVGRTVTWDLTRLTALCSAPPPVPPLPAEGDPSDSDPPDGDQP